MITANKFFNIGWGAYLASVIIPAMLKQGILNRDVVALLRNYSTAHELERHSKEIVASHPVGINETSPPLNAYVNHGRWIVKCECRGAEKAWEEGYFMCQSCYNARHKHKVRRVVFPAKRAEIEELLSARPLPNRNWRVGEDIDNLRAENEAHKEELLEVTP